MLIWRYGTTAGTRTTNSGVKHKFSGARASYKLFVNCGFRLKFCTSKLHAKNENPNACMAIAITEHTIDSLNSTFVIEIYIINITVKRKGSF